MKKIILALLLFFILYVPGYTQEPPIFLPLILKGPEMPIISEKWKVISPVESTNYVLNPSAETTGNFSALGAATATRSSTYQKYGVYSYRVQTGTNGSGITLTLSTLPNENCFATARIRGRIPINLRFIIGNSILTPVLIEKIDTQWSLYGTMFPAASCNGRTELRIIQQGNGIGDFYVDGVQVENLEYWTSYIDGDQEGCAWNGPTHATTSTRSVLSRAGGQVKDLYKDYGFLVEKVIGAGAISRDLAIDEYALLPGGEINEIKIHPREWSLIGKFIANSDDEIFQNRKDLLSLFKRNQQKQPTKILFYHPRGTREIKSFYSGGLEGDQSVFYDSWVTEDDDAWAELNKYIEKATIQLVSPDPYYYGQGDKVAILDTNDSATFRYVAARLKSTGQWSVLGPPGAGGTYSSVRAFAEDATYVYMGGIFTNFDGIANADRIVRYNKQTGVYSAMGTGADSNVLAIIVGPDGSVYAGGDFTSMGGVANTAYIARWNGSTWNALGTGASSSVNGLTFSSDGLLYAAGAFSSIGGVTTTGIASWNPNTSTWAAVGGGGGTSAQATSVTSFGNILYIGGSFVTVDGVTVNYVAQWDGTSWTALNGGMGSGVNVLAISSTGLLYAAGQFTTVNGAATSANRIAVWNGTSWTALGSGLSSGSVFGMSVGPDGILYVGGSYGTAGGVSIADRIARWNGFVWSALDIDLPGTPVVYGVYASKYADAVIPQKYDLFLGFDTTGTGNYAGKVTVNNEGSVDVFPIIIFERSGGKAVTIESVKNETTGKELLLNYTLSDGERLIIDLTPTQRTIISSQFGESLNAVLANSDFGTFILEIGNNSITSFVDNNNILLYPTEVTSWVQWKETYEGYD